MPSPSFSPRIQLQFQERNIAGAPLVKARDFLSGSGFPDPRIGSSSSSWKKKNQMHLQEEEEEEEEATMQQHGNGNNILENNEGLQRSQSQEHQ